jgi:hypothetical protein
MDWPDGALEMDFACTVIGDRVLLRLVYRVPAGTPRAGPSVSPLVLTAGPRVVARDGDVLPRLIEIECADCRILLKFSILLSDKLCLLYDRGLYIENKCDVRTVIFFITADISSHGNCVRSLERFSVCFRDGRVLKDGKTGYTTENRYSGHLSPAVK